MRSSWGILAALACSALLLSGCGPSDGEGPKLKVGTVDIVRVMEERPETTDIRLDWSIQAGDTYMEIADAKTEAESQALQQEITKRSEVWQKRMDEFMEESVELVSAEASAIAKERGLDIVVVDNPLAQTIRYRDGEDLTLDVSFKLQNREQ